MLVLTREAKMNKDSLQVGENIEIKILGVKNGQVKLGINAPKEVTVLRSEVEDRDKKEQK